MAPNVEMIRKPIEEQLAQALDITLNAVPENRDLPTRNLECFSKYRFMLTRIPSNIEVILVRIKPAIASSGR